MPKAPMAREEVEKFRNRILDIALDIILKEGFANLSIRKIASRLDVTATTIYNYYTNKDELNLMIRVRGFETLHAMLKKESDRFADNMEEQFGAMIRAYVDFGLTYSGYYDLMFNLRTPKYLDYVGTPMEATAHFEKQTALQCLDLFVRPVTAFLGPGNGQKADFVQYAVIRYWSDLHGLITLHNSRLFHEVIGDVEAFVGKRIQGMIAELIQIKERFDRGEPLSALMPG
ncbi:MAG: TetR/AcrR family transcriptional regulator [Thermodesulfobacteriota bacterium]